jgi:hypothetical protein
MSSRGCSPRDELRTAFAGYTSFYGVIPPQHDPDIVLGDLGRFASSGEFVKLGSMFREVNGDGGESTWKGVERPGKEDVRMSEEMVCDPFISRETTWAKVSEEEIDS